MGKTALEKIVEKHLKRVLPDGRLVLELDWTWGHEITTPNAILDMKDRKWNVVFDKNRVKTMIDHVNPAKDTASAIQGKIVRDWAREHGIEFLDVGRNGVCHAVIPERGWIRPGHIGIMGDSHTCTHGAFCALTAGVGTTEFEIGMITSLWVMPPQKVIRVNFIGTLPWNVFPKDLILALIKKIGVKGATNAVLEFRGPVIEAMSMEGRMTMTNMAVEAGATTGMMMVDAKTVDYLIESLASDYNEDTTPTQMLEDLSQWNSDPDAVFDQVVDIDVTGMHPQITDQFSPETVVDVHKLAGKKVNQVYIGSCTNGRIEDLRIAANIFLRSQKKVHPDVRCIVVPATQHIYEMALEEGLIKIFVEAGCHVSGPTCGACLGMSQGVIAPGEICVSTTNRNFPGRMGKDGMVHLASPATATITAINGHISEPSEEMCKWARVESEDPDNHFKRERTSLTEWKKYAPEENKRPDYSALIKGPGAGGSKDFSGKIFYLNAINVDTDQIIPAKYLTEIDKQVFGRHCLEDADIKPEDRPKLFESQVLVAGENFGCGSSREHAPWALAAAGIQCVIAPSFARIFENNMFANGLLCITMPETSPIFIEGAKYVQVIWDTQRGAPGKLSWTSPAHGDKVIIADFLISDFQKELIRNGGSVGIMIAMAAELQAEGKL